MHFSPLLHGAAGIFDEIILFAEGILVLALIVSFLRARKSGKSNSPDSPTHAETTTQPPAETTRKT